MGRGRSDVDAVLICEFLRNKNVMRKKFTKTQQMTIVGNSAIWFIMMPSDESSCPALSSYTQVNRRSFFIYKSISILSTLFLSLFLTLVCFA